jgi:hypothetical protein
MLEAWAVAIALPALVHAQVPDTTGRPSARPLALRPLGPRSAWESRLVDTSGYDPWAAGHRAIIGTRHRVLVATPRVLRRVETHDLMKELVDGCRRSLGLSDTQVVAVANVRPWAAFDSAMSGRPFVLVHVTPRIAAPARCSTAGLDEPLLVARGVVFTDRHTYSPLDDARHATVHVRGRRVHPLMYGRAPVHQVTRAPTASPRDTAMQLRLYIAESEIEPDTLGQFPSMEVRVYGPDTAHRELVLVPREVIRGAWYDLLAWRIASLRPAPTADRPAVPLPTPADTGLRRAHALYARGAGRAAAAASERRLRSGRLTAEDARYARIQLATVLTEHGDSAGARVLLAEALRDAPCLTLASTAPRAHQRLAEQVRPRGRCEVVRTEVVFRRGLAFPGRGQATVGRVGAARAAAILTFGSFAAAAVALQQANARYAAYRDATTVDDAVRLYDRASGLRRASRLAVGGGAALWLLSAAEAAWTERSHARSVERVRDYGARPLLRPAVGVDRRALSAGVALSF